MTVLSKEASSNKKQKTSCDDTEECGKMTFIIDLPEDVILAIFCYVPFPLLCRIKTVCKFWTKCIHAAVTVRLGKKQFMTNGELVNAVQEYCYYLRVMGQEKVNKDFSFDKLVSIYGFPINKWDVSQVTNFSHIFQYMYDFNEFIGDWDVSNGTTFEFMFYGASSFDQDIGNWNVSKATSFECMFANASSFDQDLGTWHVSNATSLRGMFWDASCFNGDLTNWITSNVQNMDNIFDGACSFNQDLSRWNVGRVTGMRYMFRRASKFNQDISRWDTSNVTAMHWMFEFATTFCQDLSSWDTSNLYRQYGYNELFWGATSFRRDYSPRLKIS